jgi:hypothetical protein
MRSGHPPRFGQDAVTVAIIMGAAVLLALFVVAIFQH